MLYNIANRKIKTTYDCLGCKYFNKQDKECNGLNKVCFEYDEKTQTIIDGITKLPLKNVKL